MFCLRGDEVEATAFACDPAICTRGSEILRPRIRVCVKAVIDFGDQTSLARGKDGDAIHAVFLNYARTDKSLQSFFENSLRNGLDRKRLHTVQRDRAEYITGGGVW